MSFGSYVILKNFIYYSTCDFLPYVLFAFTCTNWLLK